MGNFRSKKSPRGIPWSSIKMPNEGQNEKAVQGFWLTLYNSMEGEMKFEFVNEAKQGVKSDSK